MMGKVPNPNPKAVISSLSTINGRRPHQLRGIDSPSLGRTVLAGHEHAAVSPYSVRLVHRVEETTADGDVARYERLDLVFGECEAGEEERYYGLAAVDVLSAAYTLLGCSIE